MDTPMLDHPILDPDTRKILEQLGTEEALHTLLTHHLRLIYGIACQFRPSQDDIFSETVLYLLRNPHKYNPKKASYGRYVATLTRYTSFRVIGDSNQLGMAKTKRLNRVAYEPDLTSHGSVEKTPHVHFEFHFDDTTCEFQFPDDPAASELLWKAVSELPAIRAKVITLRFRDGMTYQEVADRVHRTLEGVRQIQITALKQLKRKLNRDDY